MDFIDRLADLLRSLMRDRGNDTTGRTGTPGDGGSGTAGRDPGYRDRGYRDPGYRDRGYRDRGYRDPGYRDPDLRAAWEELEDYMRGGAGAGDGDRTGAASGGSGGHRRTRPEPPVDESLRKDFANLEVPFGADIETVRKSYKSLMLRYHPDKFGGNPEKQRIALEITKKINESFERIRSRQ